MRLKIFLKQSFLYPYFLRYKALRQKMMSDESYFTKRHKAIFGYTPDFRNPQTFNEKIIHRILFDKNPIYTSLADKLKARIYIAYILAKYNATQSLDNVNMRWGGGSFIAKNPQI